MSPSGILRACDPLEHVLPEAPVELEELHLARRRQPLGEWSRSLG
jgi:hypothetical protein